MSQVQSEHAREVEELWAAYGRGENRRVPIVFACDEQVWLKVAGRTFREFYTDPRVHLEAQLLGRRWFGGNVIGDMMPGPPERWPVVVQLWMAMNEFLGCEVVYQDDDYAWARPLPLEGPDLLGWLADLDPEAQVRNGSAYRMYVALKELTDGMLFEDRPIEVLPPGSGAHGIFTKAAEIRGLERFCLDLYEDPDFADALLTAMTELTLSHLRIWYRIAHGSDPELPAATPFGLCDDSLQLISAAAYERFVLPQHQRLYSAVTTGPRSMHLCGYASQHYETLRRKLDITCIDGPGPFVDHAHYLQSLGPGFRMVAQTNHSVLAGGTRHDIEEMMRGLLTPGARLPGRFHIMGYLTRDTPLENVRACYEATRTYGRIALAA